MDAVLRDLWLRDTDALPILDEASVSLARDLVRAEGAALGMPHDAVARLVTVMSELARNQLVHARSGRVAVRRTARGGVPGIEVVAADSGAGIVGATRALAGTGSPSGSLGIGLAGVHELADEVDIDVRLKVGTCVWARKFAQPLPRRMQVAILARPCEGEDVCGDHAAFVRSESTLLVGVADGLGHGMPAREASTVAIESMMHGADAAPDRIVLGCHDALHGTRGAVMAVARVDERANDVSVASVGNVSAQLYDFGRAHRFGGSSFVLGSPGPLRKAPALEHAPFDGRGVLVIFSDGLSSRLDLAGDLELQRQAPIVIAEQLMLRYGRANDDALVIVAR